MKSNQNTIHFNSLIFISLIGTFFFGLTAMIFIMDPGSLSGAMMVSLMTIFLLIYIYKINNKSIALLMIFGFFLRFFFSIVNEFFWRLPSGRADALSFERNAAIIADNSRSIIEVFQSDGEFYIRLSGFIYYIFGRYPLLLQHISVVTGTLMIYIVYRISSELMGRNYIAKVSAFIITFYPALVQFSAFTRREALIYFFSALAVLYLLKWINYNKLKFFFLSSIFIFITTFFHSGMVFMILVNIILYIIYSPQTKKFKFNQKTLIYAGMMSILLLPVLTTLINEVTTISIDFLADATERKSSLDRGRAGYLQGFYPTNPFEAIYQTPVRIVYFLFTPFPWQINNLSDLYGFFLDTLPLYVLFFFSYFGLKEIHKESKVLFWVTVFIILSILIPFAWGTANYGTAIRHRQKLIWFIISIASIGIVRKRLVWRKNY